MSIIPKCLAFPRHPLFGGNVLGSDPANLLELANVLGGKQYSNKNTGRFFWTEVQERRVVEVDILGLGKVQDLVRLFLRRPSRFMV